MGLFDKLKDVANNAANIANNFLEGNVLPSSPPQQTSQSMPSTNQPLAHSMPPPPTAAPSPAPSTGGDGIYSDRLNKLIDMAVADGQLTDKEMQVLLRNAQQEGVDLDEFEMVLSAKLYEQQQRIRQGQVQQMSQMAPPPPVAAPAPVQPQSNKVGTVKKCPACGAMLDSFQTRCPECGMELSGVKANASIQQLFEMLNEIESTRAQQSTKSRIASILFTGDMVDNVTKRKIDCVNNFPIPTTREDILEFLCLAIPLAQKRKIRFLADEDERAIAERHNAFTSVWKGKCEQIIMKARFAMKDDKATLAEIEHYAKELKIK